MSKKSIISLGLQRVFLIRQNMIVQSVLLEQETESGHPLSPGFCSTMAFLSTTEKTELMFSLLPCTLSHSAAQCTCPVWFITQLRWGKAGWGCLSFLHLHRSANTQRASIASLQQQEMLSKRCNAGSAGPQSRGV